MNPACLRPSMSSTSIYTACSISKQPCTRYVPSEELSVGAECIWSILTRPQTLKRWGSYSNTQALPLLSVKSRQSANASFRLSPNILSNRNDCPWYCKIGICWSLFCGFWTLTISTSWRFRMNMSLLLTQLMLAVARKRGYLMPKLMISAKLHLHQ